MPTYLLSAYCGHDAGAVLIEDGKIVCGISQERLDRIKHSDATGRNYEDTNEEYFGFPWLAVEYCLDYAGIKDTDIDYFTSNYDGQLIFNAQKWIEFPSHHLCHAASVYYSREMEDCAILVMDYCGDTHYLLHEHFLGYERESAWYVSQNRFLPIWQHLGAIPANLFGLGNIYNQFAAYMFGNHDGEGKLMSISALGRPNKQLGEPFFIKQNGQVFVKPNKLFKESEDRASFLREDMPNYLCDLDWNALPPSPILEKKFTQFHFDLAFKVQRELEDAVLYMAKNLRGLTQSPNIGLAGGVALNCIANKELLYHSGFKNVLLPPAPGDSGQALGAALYCWNQMKPLTCVGLEAINFGYNGKLYTEQQIQNTFEQLADKIHVKKLDNHILVAAQYLKEGKIIGWFQGKSEYGPRALGARSILVNPSDLHAVKRLNEKVKSRLWFQPIAPSILEEDASQYFHLNQPVFFMNLGCEAKNRAQKEAPGIVHEDNSSRVHTVSKESNSKYYKLLSEFKKLSGIPILGNTSFNSKGQPIVETPKEAIETFLTIGLDHLILEDYLISKKLSNDSS